MHLSVPLLLLFITLVAARSSPFIRAPFIQTIHSTQYITDGALIVIRGGILNDGDYDDYDDYIDEASDEYDVDDGNRNRFIPEEKNVSVPKLSSSASTANALFGAAKKTADMATSVAYNTLKMSSGAAYHLASPKHVNRRDICGVWRLDQQVGPQPGGPFVSCCANVQFTNQGNVITQYEGESMETSYNFKERSWPRTCTIEFEARSFQGPDDDVPVLMLYKGRFRRKIANKTIIVLEGKIFAVEKRRGILFSKHRVETQIGTFRARKRVDVKELEGNLDFYKDDDELSSDFDHEEDYDFDNQSDS